jgi:predicted site-specific integrase-resolvase
MTATEAMSVLGVSYSTLNRYRDKGLIRVYKYQLPKFMGKNNYDDSDVYALVGQKLKEKGHSVVGYVRVNGTTQASKDNMAKQKNLMREFCTKRGISLEKLYEDIGASTDYSKAGRPAFHELMRDVISNRIQAVVIDTKCRLSRVGFELLEEIFIYHGVDIVIMNPVLEDPYYLAEQTNDLTKLVADAGLDRIQSEK